jgi:dUTP pyrophosphatase
MTDILIKRLSSAVDIPAQANYGDAGVDLQTVDDFELLPGHRSLVRTGIAIALPDGFAGFVHPRSGLAAKQGITVVNAPGTIDAGYRGEIMVCLLNTDLENVAKFKAGDRIAQLIVQKVEQSTFFEVEELPDALRGEKGFGSSGV